MRMTPLIAMLSVLVALAACADESSNSSPSSTSRVDMTADYYEINGVKLQLASEGVAAYVNHDNYGTFREAAQQLGIVAKLSTEEVLRLNGWEEVAEETVPKGIPFQIHPSLDPRNLFK